jgi:hypothetical protein
VYLNLSITFNDMFGSAFDFVDVFQATHDVFESRLQRDVHKHLVCYLVMLMNCNYCYCCMFGSVFIFGDVFKSVFDTGDVFCNSIFTCDVFESGIQSDVNKQLICDLVMLMNCNNFWCVVIGSVFIVVTCLGVYLIMMTCLGACLLLVMCMDYTKTD